MMDRPLWQIALERRVEALDSCRKVLKTTEAEYRRRGYGNQTFTAAIRSNIATLESCDTFAWDTETWHAVERASETIPEDARFERDLLPAAAGWWSCDAAHIPGDPASHGLAWTVLDNRVAITGFHTGFADFRLGYLAPGDTFMPLFGSTLRHFLDVVEAHKFSTVNFSTLSKTEQIALERNAAIGIMRFFLGGCVWLRQRILVTSDGPIERHCRRRLAREAAIVLPTTVKVVQLRRAEHKPSSSATAPGGDPVEWSCRWVVNGHWRNQPYGDGTTKLKYILPYVKGPADKPLRTSHTVYEVRR